MTEESYSITEVANMLELPQHVLRMWESQFPTIEPVRSRNGRRAYTVETIDSIRAVQKLLHDDGLDISTARKRLAGAPAPIATQSGASVASTVNVEALRGVLAAIETASAALAKR